jgi:hypothetical protein
MASVTGSRLTDRSHLMIGIGTMRWPVDVLVIGAAIVTLGGCAGPRWNGESRTVSGEEFLRTYGSSESLKPIRLVEYWRYGGSDDNFHYLEHWGGVTLTVPEYEYSIRARKAELVGWNGPLSAADTTPTPPGSEENIDR